MDEPNLWLQKYLTVPHVKDGRDMNGFDCWGFVVLALRQERGIYMPLVPTGAQLSHYEKKQRQLEISEDIVKCGWVKLRPDAAGSYHPIEFDILLFETTGPRFHCGLFLDKQYFVESREEVGV